MNIYQHQKTASTSSAETKTFPLNSLDHLSLNLWEICLSRMSVTPALLVLVWNGVTESGVVALVSSHCFALQQFGMAVSQGSLQRVDCLGDVVNISSAMMDLVGIGLTSLD